MVVDGDQSDAELSATMHHELRHVLLGDFGRAATKAGHADANGKRNAEVDKQTKEADDEALRNAKEK